MALTDDQKVGVTLRRGGVEKELGKSSTREKHPSKGHSKCRDLKAGTVAHAYSPSSWEVEAGKSQLQDHPQLHRESEASRSCMRLYLKVKAKILAQS